VQAGDYVCGKGDESERADSEELEGHPCGAAPWDGDSEEGDEDGLHSKRADDDVLEVSNLAQEHGRNTTEQQLRYSIRQSDDADLDGIRGEYVEGCLWQESSHGVEDHATDEDDDEENGELTTLLEESRWEERLLWHIKVVDEASYKRCRSGDDGAND